MILYICWAVNYFLVNINVADVTICVGMLPLVCLFKCGDLCLINMFKLITCNYCSQNKMIILS